MSRLIITMLAAVLCACGPCGGSTPSPVDEPVVNADGDEDLVGVAVELYRAVQDNPQHAAVVLETADLTLGDFQDMMAEIASDPELTAEYIEAIGD